MIRRSRAARCLSVLTALITALLLFFAAAASDSHAAAETVTLVTGKMHEYGTGWPAQTMVRWISHINGELIDGNDVPGSDRSYAYCVQPRLDNPGNGVYNVIIIDDDETGKYEKMRKMVYYLPGSYGYVRVTGSRWFGSSNTTGCSDFSIGHVALSYMYADCPAEGEFWDRTYPSVKAKVIDMVADLDNLEDPPFDYEVFWIRTPGKQDLFGAFYKTEYGSVNVSKTSSIPSITSGNINYSLTGAQYVLYTDPECTAEAAARSGERALITIGEDGTSNTVEMETGQYYMKEVSAPKGYALDTDVHSIEVRKDRTTSYAATDRPKSNPVEQLIQKADAETGKGKPQGGASLEGAEYTVSYYDVEPPAGKTGDELASAVSGKSPAKIEGKDAVWVFRTDASGRILMNDPDRYLVKEKSAPFYRDSAGRAVFPIGIISVKETAAPEGYEINSKTYYAAITDSGDTESLGTLKTFTGASALKEQVIRGDVKFVKTAEGKKRLGGVPFRFTSLTTGESRILVTDRNGVASTASDWNLHSKNTNAGRTAKDGIWFNGYNSDSEGAKVNDSYGALPYDTYKVEELSCEANKGYDLISDEITIERPRTCVDLGTYDDQKLPEPVIETKARDDESKGNTAVADSKVTIVDEVSYSGVAAGRTYTMEGVLMDKATGKPVTDEGGSEIRGKTEFYAEAPDGKIEVKFEMDASSLGGTDAVVFEYLKQDGELVVEHADINNKKQTVKLAEAPKPEIGTDARDGESGTGKAEADESVWIIDTVEYKNLTPGETYRLSGKLMDKETGKALLDDSGKEITAGTEFTAKTASGSIEISFRFSGKGLAGKDAVAFEYLYLKTGETPVASHEDIKDRKQTVRLVAPKEEPAPAAVPAQTQPPEEPSSPDTGDDLMQLLYCLAAMAAAGELLVLTVRRRNGRLN